MAAAPAEQTPQVVAPVVAPTKSPTTTAKAAPKPTIKQATKSILQGRLTPTAVINMSSEDYAGSLKDMYSTTGINSETSSGNGFAQVSGESNKIKTGSHIDVKAVNLKAGYAHNFVNSGGTTLAGAFVEYGNADYDAHLDTTDSTSSNENPHKHAEGNAKHYGLGLMANHSFNNGFYVQGSVKGGKTEQDYSSNDFIHAGGTNINYEGDASYIATHAGLGAVAKLSDTDKLDTYAKYLYSRTSGYDTKIPSGETYMFDAVKSQRLRVGTRYEHQVNNLGLYAGVAYEHEFDGKADGTILVVGRRLSPHTPTMEGSTGIVELGVASKGAVQFDVGLKGYAGRRKGAGLKFGVRF